MLLIQNLNLFTVSINVAALKANKKEITIKHMIITKDSLLCKGCDRNYVTDIFILL